MSSASATIYLSVREADGSVKQHAVSPGTYYFGRDPVCNFVFLTRDVSRRHVRMKLEDGAFEIEDLKSTSGTMVQGHPLTRPLRLRYPQLVEMGSGAVHLTLEAPDRGRQDSVSSGVRAVKAPAPLADSDGVTIMVSIDADEPGTLPVQGLAHQAARRLGMLYDL